LAKEVARRRSATLNRSPEMFASGRLHPFETPPGNGRYFREAAVGSGELAELRNLRSIRLSLARHYRFGLLRQLQSVFYLDTVVANRAFELRVAQEELHRAQVLGGSSIDQGWLCAADGTVSVAAGSRPTSSTQESAIRAYCLVLK
jgi:hypothetical protein